MLVRGAATATMAVAAIWSSLGPSRPQRRVLYSASKGVKSSVGLCFFLRPPTEMASFPLVATQKTKAYLQKKSGTISFFSCAHGPLPTKMTYGNLFIFVFLWRHSGWPQNVYCGCVQNFLKKPWSIFDWIVKITILRWTRPYEARELD